ncbi:unnamed protein product, partial [Nesidiocoris tenuis]
VMASISNRCGYHRQRCWDYPGRRVQSSVLLCRPFSRITCSPEYQGFLSCPRRGGSLRQRRPQQAPGHKTPLPLSFTLNTMSSTRRRLHQNPRTKQTC